MKKHALSKKIAAVVLCFSILMSFTMMSTTVLAATSFSMTNDYETDYDGYSAYYSAASNATNADKNTNAAAKAGQYTTYVTENGIGYNGGNAAMRMSYATNYSSKASNYLSAYSLIATKAHAGRTVGKTAYFESGKTYRLSFKYKVEKYVSDANLWLGFNMGSLSNSSQPLSTNGIQILTSINEHTPENEWIDVSGEYCVGTNKGVYFLLDMLDHTNRAGTSVLIDDILMEQISDPVLVTFDANGGTTAVSTMGGEPGAFMKLPVPTRLGYTFGGWYNEPEFSTPLTAVFPSTSQTVYAKWTELTYSHGTEDFESGLVGSTAGFCYRDWQVTDTYNHTPDGSKALTVNIAKGYNGEVTRPRLAYQMDGNLEVIEKSKAYVASVWLYLPVGVTDTGSLTLNYYFATLGDIGDIYSEDKAKHMIEAPQTNVTLIEGEWKKVEVKFTVTGMAEKNALEFAISDVNAWMDTYVAKSIVLDDFTVNEYSPFGIVQDYESFDIGTGQLSGNGSGKEVSGDYSHSGDKSVKLNMNQVSESNVARTIVNIDDNNLKVEKGKGYVVSLWVYSPEALNARIYLGTNKNLANLWDGYKWNEASLDVAIPANEWKKISVMVYRIAGADDTVNYLSIGARFPEASPENAKPLYVDDVSVEKITTVSGWLESHANEIAKAPNTAGMFLSDTMGNTASQVIPAGSAVYTGNNGKQYSAMRMYGEYTCSGELDKVDYNGNVCQVVERGVLIGSYETSNETNLTAESGYIGKSVVTDADALKKCWSYDETTKTVRYSLLVKNISETNKDMKFAVRSYLKIVYGGNTYTVYSDVQKGTAGLSAQKLYDAAKAVNPELKWYND